ncbi:hypothetical protein PENSUB_8486 [Penicillium subrubescens]|uniref:Uncharacterized protein n=1 Tax=Penicillium subrubescens TaxID=1316194 RepID=A0A1Q5TFV6_9EURO|nr:hypothetical protein PENSUB_8486 [Penicillium subrubescens]
MIDHHLLGEDLPSVCGGASLQYSIPAIGLGEMTAVFTLHSMMGVCIRYSMPRISKILGFDSERRCDRTLPTWIYSE